MSERDIEKTYSKKEFVEKLRRLAQTYNKTSMLFAGANNYYFRHVNCY